MTGLEIIAFFWMVPGATFLCILLHCIMSHRFARGHLRDEPIALYFLELVGPPVAITLGMAFSALVYEDMPVWIVWVFGVGGLLGWIALPLAFLVRLVGIPNDLPKQPKPRMQFTMQDMLGGAIGMGVYLFLAQGLKFVRGFTTAAWLPHLLGATSASPAHFFVAAIVLAPLAFLMALDVCRMGALPLGSSKRAGAVGGILFAGMLCLPVAVFAWARWRWQNLKIRHWNFQDAAAKAGG